jgi:hypothetical protein
MKVACWNCDGLDRVKQEAAIERMEATGIQAMVVVETFFREIRTIPQPQGTRWRRKDAFVPAHLLHEKARRAKGGISIIFCSNFFIESKVSFQFSPTGDWVVFSTLDMVIAGIYAPPALSVDAFELVLASVSLCIGQARRERPNRPVVIVGDFNAHLGPVTGDNATDKRSPVFSDFANDLGAAFLNARLADSADRWTWIHGRTRSVVDLALTLGSPYSFLRVTPPPRPTPHQMLMVTVPVSERAPVHDPERWNWSRAALAREPESKKCKELLIPVFNDLVQIWQILGHELDMLLDSEEDEDEEAEFIQAHVDLAYSFSCDQIREALSGMACWQPGDAARPIQAHREVDWKELNTMPDGFVTKKVKSMMESLNKTDDDDQVRPPIEAFAEFYRNLFQAGPEIPIEPFQNARKPVDAVDEDERVAFSSETMSKRCQHLQWRKAIGPDNLPADVLKCCPDEAGTFLHAMFSTLWAHQAAPTIWNQAFMTPIPKKGQDLTVVGNWRGIALQCHMKKIFELSVRDVMRKKGWLKHHVLQTGFQARTGALDSVFVADELTRHYEKLGRPLSAVLLDIRKAYDRTARAFIWRKLRARGCPGHVIGVLQSLLDRCSLVIRLDGLNSESVRAEVGVPQGDVLSPSMFNILVDDLPDRLVEACAPYGGSPRYGGVVMPVIMYADDQTIFHFDRRAMQAMLDAASKYAKDHFFEYNVAKSAVSLSSCHIPWEPLLIDGEAIPVVDSVPFLGVQMRLGMIDHRLQLATRLEQAERATFGLEQVGALATPLLSLARKRQLISAFCRSRVEYGMAISRHQQPSLDMIDRMISRKTGRCIGTGRGSFSVMRLSGLVPARIRQAQLHFKMRARMEAAKQGTSSKLLTVRIFDQALKDPDSQLCKYWRSCKVNKLANEKMAIYRKQYARAAADPMMDLDPIPSDDQAKLMWRTAEECAMREKAWAKHEHGRKLMKLQLQEWNKPHALAYVASQESIEIQRWMCNLTPGARYPCKNCSGDYHVSRYHLTRCTQAAALLGGEYDIEMDARQRGRADNVIDTQLPEMIPTAIRRQVIQEQNDTCPIPRLEQGHSRRRWRTRLKLTLPVYDDQQLQKKVQKLGQVVKNMRLLCCEIKKPRDAENSEGNDINGDDNDGDPPAMANQDDVQQQTSNRPADNDKDQPPTQTTTRPSHGSATQASQDSGARLCQGNRGRPPSQSERGARPRSEVSGARLCYGNPGRPSSQLERGARPRPTTRGRPRISRDAPGRVHVQTGIHAYFGRTAAQPEPPQDAAPTLLPNR